MTTLPPWPTSAALLALALVACGGSNDAPAPGSSKPSSPSVRLAAAPSSASTASTPAGAGGVFASADGLVSAPRPTGPGWDCVETVSKEVGQDVTLIKCRHVDRERFFFMMAKDYSVPPAQVKGASELATRVFLEDYKKLFKSHRVVASKPVAWGGRAGHETKLELVHASMGPVRKRERVFTSGNHVFVLSAEGKPEVVDAEAAAIDAWFEGAKFKNLK